MMTYIMHHKRSFRNAAKIYDIVMRTYDLLGGPQLTEGIYLAWNSQAQQLLGLNVYTLHTVNIHQENF